MTRHLMLAAGLLGASALAAAAQDSAAPSCAGGEASWLNGSAAAAMIGAESAPLMQQVSVLANQSPVFAFRVDGTAQETRVEAAAQNGGDPIISLSTAAGQLVAENDDYGGGLDSQVRSVLEPGEYCVRLSSLGGGPISATLQITRVDQPSLLPEAIDTTIQPCLPSIEGVPFGQGPLNAALAGGRVSQDVGSAVSYLRFDLAEATSLTLRAESDILDPQMKLYDGAGTLVAENDDAESLNARLDFLTALPAGSYCLAAGPLSAGEGSITVSAETLDRESYLRNAWRRGELAPTEGSGYPVQAIDLAKESETLVLHDGTAQWLAFDIPEEIVLIVSSFGQMTGADSRLVLFGPRGLPVLEADDSEAGLDAKLGPVVLEAGRYQLAVMDVNRGDGTTGGAIRAIGLAFERFARIK
jgi:hypothetical protein